MKLKKGDIVTRIERTAKVTKIIGKQIFLKTPYGDEIGMIFDDKWLKIPDKQVRELADYIFNEEKKNGVHRKSLQSL